MGEPRAVGGVCARFWERFSCIRSFAAASCFARARRSAARASRRWVAVPRRGTLEPSASTRVDFGEEGAIVRTKDKGVMVRRRSNVEVSMVATMGRIRVAASATS